MQTISTATVSPSDRLNYWQDVVCRVFARVECRRLFDTPVHGGIVIKGLGPVHLCSTSTSSFEYRRGADHVRSGNTDHFLINYILAGEARVYQHDRCASQGVGDIVLFDTARPYTLHYPGDIQKITVEIPRALLLSRVPQAEQYTARTLPTASPLTRLAGSVLRQLAVEEEEFQDSAAAICAGRLLLDTLAAALQAQISGPAERCASSTALCKQIQQYMLSDLGNRQISIAHLAAVHGVAERTVNRLFAEMGTTAMRWLWQQRLNASYKALAEGRARSVTDAALEFGFTSFSHFSRAFKKAFGTQPHVVAAPRAAIGRKPA